MVSFNDKSRPKNKEGKAKKTFDSVSVFYCSQKWNISDKRKTKKRKSFRLKQIAYPKQMLQRLPITLAQVEPGNTSENVLNEIR